MDLGLKGKTAVIAGGSRGIGLGIARSLTAEGCRLVVAARDSEQLAEAETSLAGLGAEVAAESLDITSPGAGEALAELAIKTFGRIDIFVGCAGSNRRAPFDETTDEDWKGVLDVNLMGHVRCSRAVIPAMKRGGGGSIVFIASIFGREAGGPGLSIYNATKSALISTAKIMAIELAPAGIRVNSVAPGSIRFPGGSWDRRCVEDPDGMAVFIEQNLPMGRFGTVEEVAAVVTFLASGKAGWISGACLNVDGVQSKSLI